jgi:hypothetical protein
MSFTIPDLAEGSSAKSDGFRPHGTNPDQYNRVKMRFLSGWALELLYFHSIYGWKLRNAFEDQMFMGGELSP